MLLGMLKNIPKKQIRNTSPVNTKTYQLYQQITHESKMKRPRDPGDSVRMESGAAGESADLEFGIHVKSPSERCGKCA